MWKGLTGAVVALTFAQRPATVEIRSGTTPVCEAVRQTLAQGRQTFQEALSKPPFAALTWSEADDSASLPGELGGAEEARFDFDNDGTLDRVFTRSFEDHYMQGSIALVRLGPRMTDQWFLPCQLAAKAIPFEKCPPFSQDNDEAGFSVQGRTPNEKPFFRGRYLDLAPFQFHGATFLAVESHSQDTSRYVAVIKPIPGKKFEPTCLLRTGH